MSSTNSSVFKRFTSEEEAKEVASLLKRNDIEIQLTLSAPNVDLSFSGNTIQNQYELRISSNDFDRARLLLEKEADVNLEEVDENHYLYEFTNKELLEILEKPDEWSEFDVVLAKNLLVSRGEEISDDYVVNLRKNRNENLAKPEKANTVWIVVGYISAFLGGLLGMTIGYFLWNQKKVLPNGAKVYTYTESDSKHGKQMFLIGCSVLHLSVFYYIFQIAA
ncbi:hypothetical protein [Owenweeksia hongkongensis]|uniref:hypothetical protein n=1 Tax=Owenweeksia hongkongensis TaxID=253245 RepID=UPI003A8F8FA0